MFLEALYREIENSIKPSLVRQVYLSCPYITMEEAKQIVEEHFNGSETD